MRRRNKDLQAGKGLEGGMMCSHLIININGAVNQRKV